jgi:hypothetical protein
MLKRNIAIGSNRKIQFILVSVILLIIISPILAASAASAEEVVEIVVKQGDCLIRIGEVFLEDPRQWREVARINNLRNPHLIHPNQILVIPVSLLRGIPGDGVVTLVQGDVRMQASDSQEWVPLHLHDRIKEGSKIQTGDKSAVEIVFENGISCFQKLDTVTGLLKMRRKGDSYEQRLSVQRGRIITKILRATGREPRFEIETPSAVCAARGTVFRTSVDPFDTARYEVLEGETEVQAMMLKALVSEGEGTIVRKGEPPTKPRKLLPPPNLRKQDMPVKKLPFRLMFDPVEGAVSYRISLTRDRDGKKILYEVVVSQNENIEIRDLEDGTYYLNTVSIDEMGLEGLPSEPEEFHVRLNPLPPFVNLPVNGAEYQGRSIQCNWLAVNEVTAYQIQVAQNYDFHHIVDEAAVSGVAYKTRELDYGIYYLRIRSVTGDGYEGRWSDPIAFTLAPPPPVPAPEPVREGSFAVFLGVVAALGLIFSLLP